ncbi:MAG: tRNA (N6-isopentenyl adenosine(37)-C2)-methylthiotransferase MiaB [Candidatus Baltobacteraceae bacterium]|jgi:tRNA-2-methylthio-N6-dimethylallyladenosine synthase
MASIYIETFGCQMNEADSQAIAERAAACGYALATDPAQASVVILNTCTVRDSAERRAYGRMAHLRALKLADPGMKLVVCGCLAEQDRDRMRKIAPHVDAVFGTSELGRLGDALESWRADFGDEADPAYERLLLKPVGGEADCIAGAFTHLRAFVTVQRGCSYYCTFCIVPYVRGRFDHRPLGEILDEVRAALARGAREITLVGQTVNAYKDPASGADFADLLAAVAGLAGLERLTFLTSHPKDFTDKLARTLGALPQLNPRLHLPVQSGSNPVLRRMNRKYSVEQYLDKVALFRENCPDWALTTDLIVGFPGETDDDFALTLELCERARFAQAFMFAYSPRRGTPASHWEQIPADVSGERFARLTAAVDRGVRARHDAKVGRVVRALVVGLSRKDRSKLSAKTGDNVTVVAPLGSLSEAELVAKPWVDVGIEAAFVWGCSGTVAGLSECCDDAAGPRRERPVIDLIAAR